MSARAWKRRQSWWLKEHSPRIEEWELVCYRYAKRAARLRLAERAKRRREWGAQCRLAKIATFDYPWGRYFNKGAADEIEVSHDG